VLDDLTAVVAEAGALALARIGGNYRRWDKTPGHPVCDVDIAVDAFLRERLAMLDPQAAWLSEETIDDPVRLGRRRVWIVDPIDGTRDYLRRRDGWCVSAALVEDGQPILGVLVAPSRGETWVAEAKKGATCNGVPLRPGDRTELAGARFPTDALPRTHRDLIAVAKPNSIALRIAMVAAGQADLLVTHRWGHEWDIAAAALIAREAGAAITDACGVPMRFNTRSAQAFGMIVAAPGIYEQALQRFSLKEAPPL